MTEEDKILEEVTGTEYKYGFTTNVESDTIPKGLNEDVIRLISKKKEGKMLTCNKKMTLELQIFNMMLFHP